MFNPTKEQVLCAIDKAFTPDISVVWKPKLRKYGPDNVSQIALFRQIARESGIGDWGTIAEDKLDQFLNYAGQLGLCVEYTLKDDVA